MPKIFVVDAFAERAFTGNPAAICLLDQEAKTDWMQSVAVEMNHSETAFVRRLDEARYELRWFTPAFEVNLCGHATLAAAHTLWSEGVIQRSQPIQFETRSGILTCQMRADGKIELDFPAMPPQTAEPPDGFYDALRIDPNHVIQFFETEIDYAVVHVTNESVVTQLDPNDSLLKKIAVLGTVVTASSGDPNLDFVSRFFAPRAGINEDPVTGSAHCCLGPLWSNELGKNDLAAYQDSPRGGYVDVAVKGDRVALAGKAVTVLRGDFL